MRENTLRSIEGVGVPLLLVFTILAGAWYTSRALTQYQALTDNRITAVETSTKALTDSLRNLTDSTRAISRLVQEMVMKQGSHYGEQADHLTRSTFYVWCIRNLATNGDFSDCDALISTPNYISKDDWSAKVFPLVPGME